MSNDTNVASENVNENKANKNIWQQNWSWLLAMLITAVAILVFMIWAHITPFGSNSIIGNDCILQYMPFFSELRYKMLHGDSLFYTWDMGGGTDFYLVITYYLSSPFNIIILLFDKSYLLIEMQFIIFAKIILASGFMGYYFSRRSGEVENKLYGTAFSVAYGLSGYICGYYMDLMWLDSIFIFPIIIIGLNKMMRGGKPYIYILALCYSMLCNFYFSFMICIFLVLYFFTYEYENIKDFIKKGLTFAVSSILSAGMSCVLLVPAVVGITQNLSENTDKLDPGWYGNVANLIRTQYMLTAPIPLSEFSGDVNLYAGVLVLMLLFIYPFVKGISIRDKIARLVIVVFMFLSMNNGLLNYIWHGFHIQRGIPNRFSILYIFMILEIGYITLESIKNLNLKCIIPAGVMGFLLPIFVYFFMDFRGVVGTKTMLVLAICSSLVYVFVICIALYNEKTFEYCMKAISIMTILEVVITAILGFNCNVQVDTDATMASLMDRMDGVEYVAEVNKDNKEFYREDVVHKVIDNDSSFLNTHGLGIFCSTVDNGTLETMGKLGLEVGYSYYRYGASLPASPFIDDVFGVRYIHTNIDERDEEGYEVVHTGKNDNITYENKDALPIGYAVSKEIMMYGAPDCDASYNQNVFATLSTGLEGPYDIIYPDFEVVSDYCNAYIDPDSGVLVCDSFVQNLDGGFAPVKLSYTVEEDGTFYTYFESHLHQIDIYINEQLRFTGDMEYQQVKIGDLKAGDKLDMVVYMPYDENSFHAIPFYMSRYDHTREMAVVQKLAEHPLTVTDYDGNSLSGNVSIGAGQMLMTTIPYSENWAVTVDGKKVESIKLMGGFLGVEMSEGDHKIEMKYTPKAFWFGLILCIVSWIMFLVYIGVVKYGKRTKPEL